MSVIINRGYNLRVVCSLNGERCSAVESFFERQNPCPSVGERGEFQCILVSLGTAVDEEELVVVVARCLTESFGEFHLQFVYHGVAVEAEFAELLREFLHIMLVAMAYADYGMSAVEVEIFLSVLVPYLASFTSYYINVI